MDIKFDEIIIDNRFNEFNLENTNTSNTKNDTRNELIRSIGTEKIYTGMCTKCNANGDITVNINGVKCLLLREDVSIVEDGNEVNKVVCQNKVGSYIKVNIKSIEMEENSDGEIYVIRKKVIEVVRKKYNELLIENKILTCRVVNIDENIGVFCDIGGDLVGIIPRSKICNKYVLYLGDELAVGDTFKALVTNITYNSLSNSIKSFTLDRKILLPSFKEVTGDYLIDDVCTATIKAITPSGIYCSVNKYIDVLCNFNAERYVVGNKVKIKIKKYNYEKNRIHGHILCKI